MDNDLQDIIDLFVLSLPGRIDILENGLDALLTNQGKSETEIHSNLDAIRVCLHNLAGIAGSLGFDLLTEKSRLIEQKIVASETNNLFSPNPLEKNDLESELSGIIGDAKMILNENLIDENPIEKPK